MLLKEQVLNSLYTTLHFGFWELHGKTQSSDTLHTTRSIHTTDFTHPQFLFISKNLLVQLSEVVKSGASSLGSPNREAQVMLINAVKDVASALADLMQSTKSASGKNIHDPAMHHLKESAKVSEKIITFFQKEISIILNS